jgi:hypothetical protein
MATLEMTETNELIRWLKKPLQDGQTSEDEIRYLFLDLEDRLQKKSLLRSDFKKYRTLHFSELCRNVFRHSTVGSH